MGTITDYLQKPAKERTQDTYEILSDIQKENYELHNIILDKDITIENQHNKMLYLKSGILLLMFIVVVSFILGYYIGKKPQKIKKEVVKN